MSDTDTITISGHAFQVPVRYAEGHELTAGEASALNQTYHENLRNNFAKKVKEGVEANVGLDILQQQLDAYAAEYEFGVRAAGGGAPRDPVMSEAMSIAKGIIRQALKKKGKKVSEVDPKAITEAAHKLIARDGSIMETAKQRVAEAQAAAGEDLSDLIADLPAAPPKAQPQTAAA